ncbi:hypothetical protein KACC15558_10980 [Brevibacterium ammoniilyticum]|uniref:Uncharacterized protein n=1 Tax=Brevibacterium ammoniilyticum TaxID=1046555 RepID=A0ABP9U1G2_9MICO
MADFDSASTVGSVSKSVPSTLSVPSSPQSTLLTQTQEATEREPGDAAEIGSASTFVTLQCADAFAVR